jgi:hypothetical protein
MYLKLYGTIGCRYWNLSSAISSAIRNPLSRRQSTTNPLYAIYYLDCDRSWIVFCVRSRSIDPEHPEGHLPLSNFVCRRWKSSTIYICIMFFPFDVRVRVQLWFMCVRVSRFVFWDQRFWFTFVSSSFSYGTSAILALHDFFLLFFLNVYVRTWFLICSNFFLLIFLQRTYKHGFRFVYVYMLIS